MNETNITNDLALNAYSVVEKSGVAIQILSVAPTSIELSYSTIDGNKPGEYGNYLAIWQSKSSIPWSKSPDTVQAVSDSVQSSGTISFDNVELTDESYVVGYSVVPQAGSDNNFCALALVPEKSSQAQMQVQSLTIDLESISSNTARINYQALAGYTPAAHNNWIGIWKGNPELYSAPPKYAQKVELDEDCGLVTFNGIKMLRDSTYTVGYFMSGWNADPQKLIRSGLACKITFRT